MADSLRTRIGEYIATVAGAVVRGGGVYGQPFDFDRTEFPYAYTFGGEENYEYDANAMEVTWMVAVAVVFKHAGSDRDHVGERVMADVLRALALDQGSRDPKQTGLNFVALATGANLQDLPEGDGLGLVTIPVEVRYHRAWNNPYSQTID